MNRRVVRPFLGGALMRTDCGSVLIVEDDDQFRVLLTTLLQRAGHATREASTGAEALAAAGEELPALVLLDIDIPDKSGYAVCRELRDAHGEELPIVFVTGSRIEQLDRVAGLLLGADDYIVKPFDGDEFIARVRRLLARSTARSALRTDAHGLTPREREVIHLLGQGLTPPTIARELFISPKTVSTHIQRILAKLGVHSRTEALSFAFREGLIDVNGTRALREQTG
jgi:DNA-binding NarL/FixJ family response regulator